MAQHIEIRHVTGRLRKKAEALLEQHYMGSSGGSGYMIAAVDAAEEVLGAVLIGPASSMAAERSIVQAPWRVWNIKRLFARDASPIPESQLLRRSMRIVANLRRETILFCAYADPAARDERTGVPLLGAVYMASNFFYIGETSQTRYAIIDEAGRARSSRQGAVTLTRNTLPAGWQMIRIPPARIWIAIVTPDLAVVNGEVRNTSDRWKKTQALQAWKAMNPARRVAARQWVEESRWRDHQRQGIEALGEPQKRNHHQRYQAAWWPGALLRRTIGPVWVPFVWQSRFFDEAQVAGERTAGRQYLPRLEAAVSSK